jgi:hypothetical protein
MKALQRRHLTRTPVRHSLCGLALMDSLAYRPDVQEYRDVDPARYAPALQQP